MTPGEDGEGEGDHRGELFVLQHSSKEEEEQSDDRRIEQHVAEVVTERILESEETGIDRPAEITHRKRLFAWKILEEDLAEPVCESALVVELWMPEENGLVIEVHEVEAEQSGMEEHAHEDEREHEDGGGSVLRNRIRSESALIRQVWDCFRSSVGVSCVSAEGTRD